MRLSGLGMGSRSAETSDEVGWIEPLDAFLQWKACAHLEDRLGKFISVTPVVQESLLKHKLQQARSENHRVHICA